MAPRRSELEKLNDAVNELLQGVLSSVEGLVGGLLASLGGKSIRMRDTYVSDSKGQVNVANLDGVITQVRQSGGDDIAKVLESIKRQVLASSDLDTGEKQEAVDNLETIGNEATKPKPNHSVMKAALERVREVIESASGIGGAIQLVETLFQAIDKF